MPQGYGLTETCASSFLCELNNWKSIGTVGLASAPTELRLRSIPEMGYSALADPAEGELLIRGGTMFTEYLKMPEKTAADRGGKGC